MNIKLRALNLTGTGTVDFSKKVEGEIQVKNTGLTAATFGEGSLEPGETLKFCPPDPYMISGTRRDGGMWVQIEPVQYNGDLRVWYWEVTETK